MTRKPKLEGKCSWLQMARSSHQYQTRRASASYESKSIFWIFLSFTVFAQSFTENFSSAYGIIIKKEKKKEKKKNIPQKMKSSGNFLKLGQKTVERISTTFFFASKTSCRACENSKSRTEVRDLTRWQRPSSWSHCKFAITNFSQLKYRKQKTYTENNMC